ncbi:DUF3426 domain-containing protein [Psychrobacter aquimaris]|uniref:DUF3426 domain-containing protein n=1 Tax=Psychrobacter aquimaris TaxID=292733 RepID=UPI0018DF81CB|nr:DUF3426 domain-containing protein [Psychrobacter aquimaris]
MTTPIKTQCPHCQACFKVQQTQLNKVNATVSCDQCQQSFLVNKHLIVTADAINTSAIQENTTTDTNATADPSGHSAQTADNRNKNQGAAGASKSSFTHPHSKNVSSDTLIDDDLIHDGLIYDDMDTDEPEESILEYDSLDSMDAWLTQASNINNSSYNSTADNQSSNNLSKKIDKNNPSSAMKSSGATIENSASAQMALSSAAANDIHANVDDTADNSWLEKLLKEQNKSEEPQQDETDLSQLLLDMGVPLKDEASTSEERVRKAQAKFTPTPQRRSIASLLWTLGCLVLALLLFAQYVIFNLETLVKNPIHAERLQAVCTVAACSLPSADLTAFTITNLNHKPSKIKMDGKSSDVSATLSNQSAKAQLYPNVKVSVYGANDLIGEFIATPADYLLSKQSQLAADSSRNILFTVPVANRQIREVTISPLY